MTETYEGSCFCGAVQFVVDGQPAAAGYCHCASCRSWAAAPVNAFSLWNPDAVTITRGAEHVGTYQKTERSHRRFCTLCGGHLMTEHPQWKLVDVYAAVIPSYRHNPSLHVHYGESVLPMRDGLPKLKDLPSEMGGSGVTMAE
jgi:hypothetical protein